MNRVTLFTKSECSLCNGALFELERVRSRFDFELELVDITAAGQESWFAAYQHDIPVVHLNGKEVFRHRVNGPQLRALLESSGMPNQHDGRLL